MKLPLDIQDKMKKLLVIIRLKLCKTVSSTQVKLRPMQRVPNGH